MTDRNNPYNIALQVAVPIEPPFAVASAPAAVSFLSKAVQPPSPVYVELNDVLQVGAATSLFNEVLTVSYRLLRADDGVLIKGQFSLPIPQGQSIVTKQEPLAEGFLLSVSCKCHAQTRGLTFARIFLTDPSLGSGQPSYMLMADYVTTAMAPAHPNGRVLAPVEGPGAPVFIQPTTPAAGAEWTITVPPNTRWKILAGFSHLVTAAGGVNRIPGIVFEVSFLPWYHGFAETALPPAGTATISLGTVRNQPANAPNRLTLPIPVDALLFGGAVISSITDNIQPGDQYTGISLLVEEWLDNV